jgi:hypothetical protein
MGRPFQVLSQRGSQVLDIPDKLSGRLGPVPLGRDEDRRLVPGRVERRFRLPAENKIADGAEGGEVPGDGGEPCRRVENHGGGVVCCWLSFQVVDRYPRQG